MNEERGRGRENQGRGIFFFLKQSSMDKNYGGQERDNQLTLGSFCSLFNFCKVLNTDRHIEFKAYGSLSNIDTSLIEDIRQPKWGI